MCKHIIEPSAIRFKLASDVTIRALRKNRSASELTNIKYYTCKFDEYIHLQILYEYKIANFELSLITNRA